MYEYDDNFYTYINEGAAESARLLLPALLRAVDAPIESVLDVGCGAGAWLSVWKSLGAQVLGLDGDYVNKDKLLIEADEFFAVDLKQGFALDKKFDLVQSLEVAEHLPESSARQFVTSLCGHSNLVLFSAATPGQGGENHINEQDYRYWQARFAEHGYAMYDPVRQAVKGASAIKSWYRYNTFLYASEQSSPDVLAALAPFLVCPEQGPTNVAPLVYRLRTRLVQLLPSAVSTQLAVIKKTVFRLFYRFRAGPADAKSVMRK